MKKISLALGLYVFALPSWAVIITPTTNITLLADELLIGSEIKHIEGDGQIGIFQNLVLQGANNTKLSLDRGVVLSSGFLSNLPNSNTQTGFGSDTNTPGDGLINAFPIEKVNRGGSLSQNAASIKLRFDVPRNVNGLIARFIYASEEFPEFSGSTFADGFAFARSETVNGIKQNINYAILPNGSPVSLLDQSTNIHFIANGDANDPSIPSITDLEFDGFTRILEVRAPVTAGSQEDFTFVVADTGDGIYDSAVFLSGLSFFNNPDFDFNHGTVSVEDSLASKAFVEPTTVPLPTAAWLFLSGLIGILARFRKNRI